MCVCVYVHIYVYKIYIYTHVQRYILIFRLLLVSWYYITYQPHFHSKQ